MLTNKRWRAITLTSYKSSREWILIDVAVPWDKNIVKAKQVEIERYEDLTRQIREIYQVLG